MPMVRLEGVRRVYRTGAIEVEALRGIDLTIREGEFVAIMGPSGSGKSTLMNTLGCLDRPTSGRYFLEGEDVATFSRRKLARLRNEMLGFVFQSFHLLPRTSALENVELPLLYRDDEPSWKEIHRRARASLETVGLGDRMEHTPNELSGGQKQRVAIARALVGSPRILLADEPTGNLDSRTSLDVMALIQELNREGLTILMVTHEADIAQFAQRIVSMRDGLIAGDRGTTPRDARRALEEWTDEADLDHESRETPAAAGAPAAGGGPEPGPGVVR